MLLALFPSQLWAMWILKIHGKKMKHALPQLDFKRVAVEFDNLILTKYHGLKIVFETAEFENLTPRIQRMRLIKSADEVQK